LRRLIRDLQRRVEVLEARLGASAAATVESSGSGLPHHRRRLFSEITNGSSAVTMLSGISGSPVYGGVVIADPTAAVSFGPDDEPPMAAIHSPAAGVMAMEGDVVFGGDVEVRGELPATSVVLPVRSASDVIPPESAVSVSRDGFAEAGWGLDLLPSRVVPQVEGGRLAALRTTSSELRVLMIFNEGNDSKVALLTGENTLQISGTPAVVPDVATNPWSTAAIAPVLSGEGAIIVYVHNGRARVRLARASGDAAVVMGSGPTQFSGSSSEVREVAVDGIPGTGSFVVVETNLVGSYAWVGEAYGSGASLAVRPSISSLSPSITFVAGRMPSVSALTDRDVIVGVTEQTRGESVVAHLRLDEDRGNQPVLRASTRLPSVYQPVFVAVRRISNTTAVVAYRSRRFKSVVRVATAVTTAANASSGSIEIRADIIAARGSTISGRHDLWLATPIGGTEAPVSTDALCDPCDRSGRFVLVYNDGEGIIRVIDGVVAERGGAIAVGSTIALGDGSTVAEGAVAAVPTAKGNTFAFLQRPVYEVQGLVRLGRIAAGPNIAGFTRPAPQPVSGGSTASRMARSLDSSQFLYNVRNGILSVKHVVGIVTSGVLAVGTSMLTEPSSAPLLPGAFYGARRSTGQLAPVSVDNDVPPIAVALTPQRLSLMPSEFLQGNDPADLTVSIEETPGTIKMMGTHEPPLGWLFCDGSVHKRSILRSLFEAIGCTFGCPDAETFSLPDLRGRFPFGASSKDGSGTEHLRMFEAEMGRVDGSDAVKINTSHVPTHSHDVTGWFPLYDLAECIALPGGLEFYYDPFEIQRGDRRTFTDENFLDCYRNDNRRGLKAELPHQTTYTSSTVGESELISNTPPHVTVGFFIRI
jgi:hypothetical protein